MQHHPWKTRCRDAAALLDDALSLSPLDLTQQVDDVERGIVQIRDDLIDLLREQPYAPQAVHWRSARGTYSQSGAG